MRSVFHRRGGDPLEVTELGDLPNAAEPGPEEITVRLAAASVHRGDLVGIEAAPEVPGPVRCVGTEGTGTITAVGKSVTGLYVGDRVALFPAAGTWAECLTLPASSATRLPDAVADETASVMLVNPITAQMIVRAVERIRALVHSTAPLVVTAAASGVGRLVIHEASARGIPVVAIVRSDRSAVTVRALFPTVPVVVTADDEWREAVRRQVGSDGVPAIADAHGGSFVAEILPFLAPGGTLVVWGDLQARAWTITTGDLLMNEYQVQAVSISRWLATSPEDRAADVRGAVELAARRPDLLGASDVFPLEDFRDALVAARAPGRNTVPVLTMSARSARP
jgi:NADPH:quinone reductase-like Zn-dependent oxidoreductase